jgi:hypothetical protein
MMSAMFFTNLQKKEKTEEDWGVLVSMINIEKP